MMSKVVPYWGEGKCVYVIPEGATGVVRGKVLLAHTPNMSLSRVRETLTGIQAILSPDPDPVKAYAGSLTTGYKVHSMYEKFRIEEPAEIWVPASERLAPLLVTPISRTSITGMSVFFSLAALCYLPVVRDDPHAYSHLKSLITNLVRTSQPAYTDIHIPVRRTEKYLDIHLNPILHYTLYLLSSRHIDTLRESVVAAHRAFRGEKRERLRNALTSFAEVVETLAADRIPARIVFLPLLVGKITPAPGEIEAAIELYRGTPLENTLKEPINRFLGSSVP